MVHVRLRLFLALFRQAYRGFVRNWMAIGFSLIAPIALIGVFVAIVSESRPIELRVVLHGPSDETMHDLIDSLGGISSVAITKEEDLGVAKQHLREGLVDGIVIVQAAQNRTQQSITVLAPKESIQLVTDLVAPSVELGTALDAAVGPNATERDDVRVIQHPVPRDVTQLEYVVPGIIVMGLMGLAFPTAGHNTALARQDGLMRLYAVVPIPAVLLITSEVAFLVLLAVLQSALLLVVAHGAFGGIDIGVEQAFLASIIVVMGAGALVGLGVLIGGCIPNTSVAINVLSLLNAASLVLSNLFWPAGDIEWLRPLGLLLPATWVCDALRQAVTGAPGMAPLMAELAVIAALTLAFVGLAAKFFRFDDSTARGEPEASA